MKHKFLKILFALAVLSFFSFAEVFSQSTALDPSSSNGQTLEQNVTDESQFKVNQQSSAPQASAQNTDDENSYSISDSGTNYTGIGAFVRMILVLAVFVAVIFFLFKFIKKQNSPSPSEENPFLRRAFQLTLSPGKTVQIVTLVDSAYILGVSDSNVNLIEKITDKEMVNAINLYADKNATQTKPKSFSELLDIFMPNRNKKTSKDKKAESDEILDGLRSKVRNMEEEQ